MSEPQFLKVLIFPRTFYLKFISVLIINGSTILFSEHGNVRGRKHEVGHKYLENDVYC